MRGSHGPSSGALGEGLLYVPRVLQFAEPVPLLTSLPSSDVQLDWSRQALSVTVPLPQL